MELSFVKSPEAAFAAGQSRRPAEIVPALGAAPPTAAAIAPQSPADEDRGDQADGHRQQEFEQRIEAAGHGTMVRVGLRRYAGSVRRSRVQPQAASRAHPATRHRARSSLATLLCAAVAASACSPIPYDAERATLPYPRRLHTTEGVVDIEVFRDGETLSFVNATTRSYENVRVWLNQRYMLEVESIPAGQTTRISLGGFWDRWGGSPERGGFLRRFDPTPIRLVELQLDDTTPLVGLVVIPAEPPRSPRQLQG